MAYDLYDFTESLDRLNDHDHGLTSRAVESCEAAWGHSPEGVASWEGGFLLRLKDGRYAYLEGWCDTTGWGCQDGIGILLFDQRPKLNAIERHIEESSENLADAKDWDEEPVDLNRYLRGEINVFD